MNQDMLEGKWKEMIGRAKVAWGELTDDELAKVDGRADKLAGLIQQKYGITLEAAQVQAREFFERHRG